MKKTGKQLEDENLALRKRVHELEESEEKYRILTEHSPDFIVRVDRDLRQIYANNPAAEALNLTTEEILGKTLQELGIENWELLEEPVKKAFQSGEMEKVILDVTINNKQVTLDSINIPEVDNKGRVTTVLVVARDITEKQKTEEALRESEERYRTTIERTGQVAYSFSPDTGEVNWDGAIKNITGYDPEVFKQFNVDEWGEHIHPEDQDRVFEAMEKAIHSRSIFNEIYRLRRMDGSYIYVEEYGVWLTREISPRYSVVGVINDITEKKKTEEALRKSEERLRLTIDGADLGMWDWNLQTGELYLNNKWYSQLGYRPDEINPSIDWWRAIVHSDDRPHAEKLIDDHLKGKTDLYKDEFRVKKHDGNWVWFADAGKVIEWDSMGNPMRMCGIHIDITDRKNAEASIEKQNLVFSVINDLFSRSILCNSTFEAAQICLSIALQITNSQYGSVAEVNARNRFDTLALSDTGWEVCKMAQLDPSCIQDMEIRGIWKVGLESPKGIIINDPLNHPKSVGIPDDHPPLTSFLAMPFKHLNFNGMIGIANKDGGFNEADREIIEALSLAFAEVINSVRNQERLKDSLKEKEILLREVYHRTKNNMQVITAMLHLKSTKMTHKEDSAVVLDIENKIKSMALVYEKLMQSNDLSHLNLKSYFESLISYYEESISQNNMNMSITSELESIDVLIDVAIPLGLVLNELISNVLKHAFRDKTLGKVAVTLNLTPQNEIVLKVSDNGIGLKNDFNIQEQESLGMQTVFGLIEHQLKGKITMKSQKGLHYEIVVNNSEQYYKPRI